MRMFRKAMSLVLSAALCLSSVPFSQAKESTPTVNPISVVVEQAGGSMNLTEMGSLDWVHMTSDVINRKANIPEELIQITQLNPNEGVTTLNDCPVSYSWTDGNVDETMSGNTKGAVYNWKNGDESSVGVEITEDTGYSIQIPASDEPRVLTFVSGVWQSDAVISIYANGEETPVYTNTELTAGGSVVNKKYTVNIRSGNSVEIVCKLNKKAHSYGNLNLSAVALSTMEIPDSVKVDIQSASGSMNLTEMGDLDWMHITGTASDSSSSQMITTRKAGVEPQITFETLKDNSDTSRQTDSRVSFTWTDGQSDGGEEYNAMTDSKLGGVMNWRGGDESSVGDVPEDAEAGYRISVPSSESARTLTFVSGVWQSQGVISIYLNGESEAVYSVPLEADGNAVANIYTISLSAGDSALVEFKLKSKSYKDGNISLGAITLGTDSEGLNFRQKLEDLVKEADSYDTTDIDEFFVNQLKAELAYSKGVLENPEASNLACYEAYTFLKAAFDAVEANTKDRKYTYTTNPGLTASFGWEGDKDAPIAYIDGSYQLRDRGNLMITFGVWDIPGDISWYNKEGYLPCFVSEYEKNGMSHVVESFADLVVINENRYEVAYSRMTTTNNTDQEMTLPRVSAELIPLNDAAKNVTKIQPGETVVRDYAIGADRFGGSYEYPEDSVIAEQGSWDEHYDHMKQYWNERLEPLAEIVNLPDEQLINAYKAGYIYTLIIGDNYELHVGENGYDRVFDHDVIGMISTLINMGDYENVKEYMVHILDNVQYPDARWKYSWPFALYLLKSGDVEYILEMFDTIKENTHYIETQRTGDGGIMMSTNAIDSNGYWLIDNWAALAGLTCYQYICDTLYELNGDETYLTESEWSQNQYDELLAATEKKQAEMREKYDYSYLSIDMNVPTEQSARSDARDANWASMFLFGRWSWDGYLFGAEQEGSEMINLIDDTYTHGFERREDISDSIYNFGGYPHGYYCSAYNAGYGSAALRGEEYRDSGIKAYQFMIENAMSGPFGWWEGVDYPNENSPWDIDHAAGGGGSCQHMWGQSTATKVLFDSLIAVKSDGTAIVGRGIPAEWIVEGEKIEIADYPVSNGARMGYSIETEGKTVTVTFTGDNSNTPVSLELLAFKDNIASAEGFEYDEAAGIVTVPAGTKSVTVVLKEDINDRVEKEEAIKAVEDALDSVKDFDPSLYTTSSANALTSAIETAETLLADENATVEALNAAAAAVTEAADKLVALSVGEIGIDYNGKYVNTYRFGDKSDQIRRYQTFKTGETAGTVGYVDVSIKRAGNDSRGDVVATLYTLEDDHKTLKDVVDEYRIPADQVVNGNNRLYFEDVVLEPDTYYALALGQDRTSNDQGYYTWDVVERVADDLYFVKDTGDKYVDESNLGTGTMSVFFEAFNKADLDAAVQEAEKLDSADYTDESWAALAEALEAAKAALNDPQVDKDTYEAAKAGLANAMESLVLRPISDKTLLQATYDYALTLDTKGVVESAVKYFEKVLAEAKAVLDDEKATQEEVDAAWDNLLEGIWGLGITQGDKTQLEMLITRAEKMVENADKYVATNWQQLLDALEAAKGVMDDGDALQADVEKAANDLNYAMMIQRYKADKSNLEDLINKANGIDLSQYTAESVAVFTAALETANLVLADESLSEDDQDTVDRAVQKLDSAMDQLVKLSDSSDTEKDPENGSENTDTPDVPATGDNGMGMEIAAVLMMSLTALCVVYLKKRKTI